MSMEEFENILQDSHIEVPRDFGIYGEHILYVGEDYRPDNIVGYYMRDLATLAVYRQFFDRCWEDRSAKPQKVDDPTRPMSCDDLFGPGECSIVASMKFGCRCRYRRGFRVPSCDLDSNIIG